MERLEKGISITNKLSSYVVIDLETTGLMPDFDEIIEFAGIKIKDGKEVERFNTLIKPQYEISAFITELTGITNEMLKDAPSIMEVIDKIIDFIGADVIVGHNVNFDVNFLYDNVMYFKHTALSNNFEDTMRLARKLFKDFPNHRLITCCEKLNKKYYPSHRAMADVEATQELLTHIYDFADSNNIDLVDAFQKPWLYDPSKKKLSVSDIVATVDNIDEDNPLFGLSVCFTGTLEKMVRKDALQLVKNLGGIPMDSVTKTTNLLVLGDVDYKNSRETKSNKYKKAEELILKGYDLKIISETVFLDMIDDDIEAQYYRK